MAPSCDRGRFNRGRSRDHRADPRLEVPLRLRDISAIEMVIKRPDAVLGTEAAAVIPDDIVDGDTKGPTNGIGLTSAGSVRPASASARRGWRLPYRSNPENRLCAA